MNDALRYDPLQYLAGVASHVADNYPDAARELHRWIDAVSHSPAVSTDTPERRAVVKMNAVCEQYRQRLNEVRDLTIQHMPNVAKQLQWVMRKDNWFHRDDRFDWTPLVGELRDIEASAKSPTPPGTNWPTATDAALAIDMSKRDIGKLANDGEVSSYRDGRNLHVDANDLVRHKNTKDRE